MTDTENIDKVQAMSKAIMAAIADEFEGERPDLVLLAVLDVSIKVVRLFNPDGTTVECCDAVLEVMKNIREGEAVAIPCNQNGCKAMATHWYVWPTDGKRKDSCAVHTQKAIETLHVMGFELQAHLIMPVEGTSESMGG
jgi:hypothetical protein